MAGRRTGMENEPAAHIAQERTGGSVVGTRETTSTGRSSTGRSSEGGSPVGGPPDPVPREGLSPEALDRRALARAAAGESDAFVRLVERHQDRLLRVCQGFLHDPEEARDAVQEIFLKAFRKAGSYRPRGKVYTWLYRIAVNHCLNRLRRRKIVRFLPFSGRRAVRPDDPPEPDPTDPRPGPAERLDARRRWHLTRRALDALPESQRSVVILAKIEGLSQRQTAEVLGISEGAVESRLFRALRKLEAVVAETQERTR